MFVVLSIEEKMYKNEFLVVILKQIAFFKKELRIKLQNIIILAMLSLKKN